MVRACPSGAMAVGKWENISPPAIPLPGPRCGSAGERPCKYGVMQVLVNPQDTSIVYVGSDQYGIFKSTDCGANWVKINTGRNGAALDTGESNSMVMDPVDPRVIYTTNLYGNPMSPFKSIDGGVNWDPLFPSGSDPIKYGARGGFAVIMSLDPTNHQHLVIAFHDGCTAPYAPDCLAETNDAGATWRLVKMPVPTVGLDGNGVVVLSQNIWLYGLWSTGTWRTADRGLTWTQVAPDGGHNAYRTATAVYIDSAQHGLQRSVDMGLTWTGSNPNNLGSVQGDGRLLYAGANEGCTQSCYYTSPQEDGVKWTPITTGVTGQGKGKMAYDPDHHILYSSNSIHGLWRVVTY
jgi:hypothetical protein